ncbi:MAG: AarF/UbiB family protein [Syntrophomonas sp.]|nr:AarF/UbiB family protein [Syntrophomonas sp.]
MYRIINNRKAQIANASEMVVPGLVQKIWQQVSIKDLTVAKEIASLKKPNFRVEKLIKKQLKIDSVQFLAHASVGIVYKADVEGRAYAIKVKHPGIEKTLTQDMLFLKRLVKVLSIWLPEDIKHNLHSIIEDVIYEIRGESDYIKETVNHQYFYETLIDEEIIIPALNLQYCSDNIIVSEYSPGQPLTSFWASANIVEKRWFLDTYHRFILMNLLYCGKIHADPHPYNFLIETDRENKKRLVVMDFGCVKEYSAEFIIALRDLLQAVKTEIIDEEEIIALLIKLGIENSCLEYYHPVIGWLTQVILEPYCENRDIKYSDWNIDYKISTILSSRVWEKPLSFSADLLYLFRVYDALISYWQQANVPINWYKIIQPILGGLSINENI